MSILTPFKAYDYITGIEKEHKKTLFVISAIKTFLSESKVFSHITDYEFENSVDDDLNIKAFTCWFPKSVLTMYFHITSLDNICDSSCSVFLKLSLDGEILTYERSLTDTLDLFTFAFDTIEEFEKYLRNP